MPPRPHTPIQKEKREDQLIHDELMRRSPDMSSENLRKLAEQHIARSSPKSKDKSRLSPSEDSLAGGFQSMSETSSPDPGSRSSIAGDDLDKIKAIRLTRARLHAIGNLLGDLRCDKDLPVSFKDDKSIPLPHEQKSLLDLDFKSALLDMEKRVGRKELELDREHQETANLHDRYARRHMELGFEEVIQEDAEIMQTAVEKLAKQVGAYDIG